jgi:hypothetical protein
MVIEVVIKTCKFMNRSQLLSHEEAMPGLKTLGKERLIEEWAFALLLDLGGNTNWVI